MRETIRDKIKAALTQDEIGRAMGCKQQTVWQWLNSQVPAKRVIPLCDLMRWEITPHEIRPDIYPNPTDGLPLTHEHIISSVKTQEVNNHDHP
ncbi:helix-turn-helix domain-containing protein [Salmonella enterica]|nr:hypothetical protein [Salmonella enterica]ECJ4226553.1 hypothetical protein [Salmonella enterica subsp. enterica]EDQ4122299.1 helix-turn-helix domain-containing protein [Salmonella enterica subsp. enterica serovar Sandiego]EEJ6747855.1 helix-turn-helix domain-containing protein [Salmonella enterica subsp. enterica serovar Oslo]EEM1820661.1 hypothetical protein [Salmonella enterica subsp. enterica serovar Abaetetuba]HBJ6377166.1 helix-turn-helix domain-containing protein [Salmonella enterica